MCRIFSTLDHDDAMLRNCKFPSSIYQTESICGNKSTRVNFNDFLGLFMACLCLAICDVNEILMDKGQRPTISSQVRFMSRYGEYFLLLLCLRLRDESFVHFSMILLSVLCQTFCFYFFSLLALSSTLCIFILCSHPLRIIIIHIFFRFLINSVHI